MVLKKLELRSEPVYAESLLASASLPITCLFVSFTTHHFLFSVLVGVCISPPDYLLLPTFSYLFSHRVVPKSL
jgi:hypothetical protein